MLRKNNIKPSFAILGGSFNPPHIGHIFISQIIYKKFNLKKVIWLVSPKNPLKNSDFNLDNFQARIQQCKKICENNNFIEVSDLEYKFFQNKKNYFTIDFLKRYSLFNKNIKFQFIIGADNLINFHRWKDYKNIEKYCEIIVVNRVDNNFNLKYKAQKSKFGISGNYKFINAKTIDISSTKIRNKKL